MEKLLLLLTVTLAAGYYTDDGQYIHRHIIMRGGGCSMAKNMRELIDRHHNYLRQKVANGEKYLGKQFQEQEMCGLIYDCELEVEARKEQENPGSAAAKKLGVVRFKREYKRSQLDAVQAGLEALVNDNDKLRQMTNPKATRFGCYVRFGRFPPKNVREVDVVCVYDKKTRRKDAQQPKGLSCYEHWEEGDEEERKCSFYKNSKCLWDLCYVLPEGEDVKLAAGYYTDDGQYIHRHIIMRGGGCSMARNMRELIDRHHNYLRQKVANGEKYLGKQFEEQEMCGLIYDCDLEVEARKEQENPGSAAAKKLGVVRFKRSRCKCASGSIRGANLMPYKLALVNDNDKLRQMNNPKATRFGCYVRYGRFPPKNVREVDMVCVYDKKTRRKDAQKPKGLACYEDWEEGDEEARKCSFFKNSKCLWGLCYVLPEGEDVSILQ